MLTRCPECSTHFRVRPNQLRAAGGRVRCGRCGCLFDARPLQHEIPVATPVLPAPANREPAQAPAAPPIKNRKSVTLLWGLGTLLLGAALLAQAAWWDRHKLAEHPDMRPWILKACHYLPCGLTPPRSPQHIEVLDRALDTHPTQAQALLFTLRIVNRWDRPQAYPRLELSLLDRNGEAAGIRRFEPSEYIPDFEPGDVLATDAPVDINLVLQDPDILIGGFRIDFL